MDTNALFALGFLRKGGDSYDRSMMLCGKLTKISISYNEYTDDWGISFNDGNVFGIGEVDEILDFVADYVENKGDI